MRHVFCPLGVLNLSFLLSLLAKRFVYLEFLAVHISQDVFACWMFVRFAQINIPAPIQK